MISNKLISLNFLKLNPFDKNASILKVLAKIIMEHIKMKQQLLILLATITFLFPTLSTAALISASATTTETAGPGATEDFTDSDLSAVAPNVSAIIHDSELASAKQSGELRALSGVDATGGEISGISTASWEETVTNLSGGAASYQLDFSTGSGEISFSDHTNEDDGSISSTGSSGYSIEVLLNGSSIWQSSAEISESQGTLVGSGTDLTRSVYSFSESGVDFNGALDLPAWTFGADSVSSSYKFDPTNFNLSLGDLSDGESLTVTYMLRSFTDSVNLGGTGIGADSFARISEVPLPATLPLLFSGIFGFFVFARKK